MASKTLASVISSVARPGRCIALALLPRLTRLDQIAAIGAALPVASEDEADALYNTLTKLAARDRTGYATRQLIRHWLTLPDTSRTPSCLTTPDPLNLASVWEQLARHSDRSDQLAAFAFAGDCLRTELAEPIAQWLSRTDEELCDAACDALQTMAARLAKDPSHAHNHHATLASVLSRAAYRWREHRNPRVLDAYAALFATPAQLAQAADDALTPLTASDHPATTAMRSWLRRSRSPVARQRALLWLTHAPLRSACADRITMAMDSDDHVGLLHDAHLLLHPARRRALAATDRGTSRSLLTGSLPTPEALAACSPRAQLGAARLLATLPVADAAAEDWSLRAALSTLPATRHALINTLRDRPACAGALVDLAFDADEHVARAATLSLTTYRVMQTLPRDTITSTLRSLKRAPSRPVRTLAAVACAHHDILDSDAPAAGNALATRQHARNPDALADQLRAAIASSDTAPAIAAISQAARLRIVDDLWPTFKQLLTPPFSSAHVAHSHTRAAAVSALATSYLQDSADLLHSLAADADPRTAANAIDALARRSRCDPQLATRDARARLHTLLLDATSSKHHRVRATAVRWLLTLTDTVQDAAATTQPARLLTPLLTHDSAQHRAAGLWALSRTLTTLTTAQLDPIASALADIMQRDPDPALRRWAATLAHAVLALTRHAWATRTPGFEDQTLASQEAAVA